MTSSGLVDFHCHLDLYPDHEKLLIECDQERVFTLAVTTTPRAWPRNNELAIRTKHVRAALGLHPQLVSERANEFALWQEYLPASRYVGEVGLDASPRFYNSFDLQKEIFEKILRSCAQRQDKILTLHSVRAVKPVLDMLEAHLLPRNGKAVLHWFTGTASEAKRACELGCYFSINATMLNNDRHRKLIAAMPLDRLLTETDGPFTQLGGSNPARPRDVKFTVEGLADIRSVSPDEMRATIQENLRRLVSA
ncbi:Qat anti-phage system TatD family nuclease QatD [Bradyrhizobium elkanii]|uniref:Qat anti-phage system TatD family nuclease QatD n=1 Tax=Bradyrhizobium elkanii TaxID=29448 RepID=UPI003515FA04